MDPKYAVKNVMCDRIGMDKSAYNQMNSLKRNFKKYRFIYWDMQLREYVTNDPNHDCNSTK